MSETMTDTSAVHARPELLQVAETVARDKGIERDEILEAMEQAIQKAGRSKYGQEHDIRAHIDRTTGTISLARFLEVLADDAEIENEVTQVPLARAFRKKKDAVVGEFIVDELPPIDFGRIAAQTAKQVIVQKVREAERTRQFSEYKDRLGEVVNGLVKRIEYGNVIVDLGRSEAMLRRDECIPREHFNNGDRVRAYILDVREEARGPQIFLSRTHPEFMAKLFAQEVPEIYDGIIEIKAVARDPGSRAKMAVISHDSSLDPVGPCIGMRGSRVQAVVGELQGEKIDIIQWSDDPAMFIVNALAPAEVAKESERRTKEFQVRSQMFVDALDVDEVIAHLLVTEGFAQVEEVAFVPAEDLFNIEGFDEDVAAELQQRARNYLAGRDEVLDTKRKELGVADDVGTLEGVNAAMLIIFGENEVKTRDDLGDLAGDELLDMVGSEISGLDQANEIIMAARAHWFDDEETKADDVAPEAGTE
jgi:N utilization substance protein A